MKYFVGLDTRGKNLTFLRKLYNVNKSGQNMQVRRWVEFTLDFTKLRPLKNISRFETSSSKI